MGVVLLVLAPFNTSAQNFSGLENTSLTKINDLSGTLTDLFSKFEGKIDQVTVLDDTEKNLSVNAEFSGTETGYLIARVLSADRKQQIKISSEGFSLEGKSSPVELNFNLSEQVPEGTELTSAFLEIKLSEKKNDFAKKTFLFTLPKKWQSEVLPENLVIPITLEPVGSAANLEEVVQTIVIPQKKQVLKFDKASAIKLKSISGATRTTTGTIGTTPTKKNIDGTYNNANKNTRDITKMIVSENGSKIQVFGKCSPKDCDWGVKTLKYNGTSNTYTAVFGDAVAISYFTLSITGNTLKSSHKRVYRNASRGSKVTEETFSKWAVLMSSVATLSTVTAVPLAPTGAGTSGTDLDTEEEVNVEPLGPANEPISLWEDLVADNDFEFPYEVTNIRMDIYPDINKNSGTFYYVPNAYHLRWNKDEGYNFRMIYGTSESAEVAGAVRMTGTLTPGISTNEIALIRTLLESYTADSPVYTFNELKIMPIQSVPSISLSSGLQGQYDIPEENINVTVSSSINNPLDVSWVTDNDTKEEMQVALTQGLGINGEMRIVPESEEVPEQLIPVRITISDPRTIGRFTLQPNQWRDENWKNTTAFPLLLKKIHVLIIEKQGTSTIPLIYTWNLNDTQVPAGASASFDADEMPLWIETKNKAERIWIDYGIVECTTCVDNIIDELIDGTINRERYVSFQTFKIIASEDIAFLNIKVRSLQGDPKKERMIELSPVRVTEDLSAFSAGPFHLSEEEELDFEYHFTLVMNDGVTHTSRDWISSNEAEVFLGMHSLYDSIDTLEAPIQEEDE